jgi:hypothetical protein
MSGKRADVGSRAVNGLVGMAAAFGARKVMIFAWKQVTGKEPPEHPEDVQVALREAILWSIVIGAAVNTARLLATRAAARRMLGDAEEAAE